MQRNLILILTRRDWIPGNAAANFRELRVFTDLQSAIKQLRSINEPLWEPLGIREGDTWVWNA